MHADSPRPTTPFIQTLPGVVLAVLFYTLTHATTRLIASGNLGEDDPLASLQIQQFALGYSVEHGPLYNWLLWGVQKIAGPGLSSFLLIKYSLLTTTAAFLYLVTRRLTGSCLWGFMAVESMASVYQIFWRLHEGFTDRVLTMALAMATLWATFRIIDQRRLPDYCIFAALAGLGLLSEHTYIFLLISLLLAIALQSDTRPIFFDKRLLTASPLILLTTLPYLVWLATEPTHLKEFSSTLFPPFPAHSVTAIKSSLYDALTYPVLVLSPYILIVPLLFPRVIQTIFRKPPEDPTPEASLNAILSRTLLIQLCGIVLGGGLIWAHADYAVHVILPMMVITIPWLTKKIQATSPSLQQIRRFMLVLLIFTGAAYAMRSGNLFIWEPFCSRCRWGTPYAELADQLQQAGFRKGNVITNDLHTAGNLRRFFPDSHFSTQGTLPVASGKMERDETWLLIWPTEETETPIPATMAKSIPTGALLRSFVLDIPWQGPIKPRGYRHTRWGITIVTR